MHNASRVRTPRLVASGRVASARRRHLNSLATPPTFAGSISTRHRVSEAIRVKQEFKQQGPFEDENSYQDRPLLAASCSSELTCLI